jgi:hypothetical protein
MHDESEAEPGRESKEDPGDTRPAKKERLPTNSRAAPLDEWYTWPPGREGNRGVLGVYG